MPAINFKFISNTGKWLKQVKLFECFKSKPPRSSVLFPQETHSNKEIEQKWKIELNGQIFFPHEKSNLCRLFIAFFASKSVTIQKEISKQQVGMLN